MLLSNLRTLRSKKGWNQTQLALASNVSQGLISKYEIGATGADLGKAAQICVALKCTLKQLVGKNEYSKFGIFGDRFRCDAVGSSAAGVELSERAS